MVLFASASNLTEAAPINVCSQDHLECAAPSPDEYTYGLNGSSRPYASLNEVIQVYESSFALSSRYQGCPQTLIFTGTFTEYAEEGRGNIEFSNRNTANWVMGLNNAEQVSPALEWQHTRMSNSGECVDDGIRSVRVLRGRNIICPAGFAPGGEAANGTSPATCIRSQPPVKESVCRDTQGNPCQVSTGAKIANETDIQAGQLVFDRHYHSQNLSNKGLGKGWHNQYFRRLSYPDAATVVIGSASGKSEIWEFNGTEWEGEPDINLTLSHTGSEYTVTNENGVIDVFDETSGALLRVESPDTQSTVLHYNAAGQLIRVTNSFQHELSLSYDAEGRVATVSDSAGQIYSYQYDAFNNLSTVVYPDSTPLDSSDNPTRVYHYEDVNLPNHLTGITDENGDRIATYAYDANGKAVVTEHAQTTNPVGQERFELDYQGAN